MPDELANGNLFTQLPESLPDELFEELATGKSFRLERIVSQGQATPDGDWYDQETSEWVALLAGSAAVHFEGESSPRVLRPGDYLFIPARCRHRVAWTDRAETTVWLALHFA